ncbi:L-histidine N(alpha)-methyltransferase [Undibacterium sp. 5I1]|nr:MULTISPECIES: L-histidine N(alpha)-methyltransferase [unclassified Undibacterium]MDY7537388.1 L-histidine N(alpha)-methyltransferase [Undibacterium sp. 5I1]MEB0232013.1 L-histidine N(alpha)-methyltransferase [Undibacterium sp. 10I3]
MPNTESLQRIEIIEGLSQPSAQISPKYFYDTKGCELFEAITLLPEYYLTRTEQSIMASYSEQIAQAVGKDQTIIELGAGSCEKVRRLFHSIKPAKFIAVDIASDFLVESVRNLRQEFPEIDIRPVVADLTSDVILPEDLPMGKRLVFYPGSSIGNFDRQDALALLTRIRRLIDVDGALLIGVDLRKNSAILEAAYDDAAGVTAAFNLNVLNHINRLIASDFKLTQWRHLAIFNTDESRIEMHLEAIEDTQVSWPDGKRYFKTGEKIHTENSYKYTPEVFMDLLTQGGFKHSQMWTDENGLFAVMLARP